MAEKFKYHRVLLKLGGEALAPPSGVGIDPGRAEDVAQIIKAVVAEGLQIDVVIGAGNLWRGRTGIERGMDRTTADHMGMLGTVINAIALQDALERDEVATRMQTAIEMKDVAEPYIRRRAVRHLEKGRVIILGAGTGNPYFTTDTAGALRAIEIDANILIKATKVDGVYDADPVISPEAKKFKRLTYIDAINLRLKVIDSTALSLCMDNDMPILVMDLWGENSLIRAMKGEPVGTLVSQ